MSGSYEQVLAVFYVDDNGNVIQCDDVHRTQDDMHMSVTDIFNRLALEQDELEQIDAENFDVIIDHYNGHIELLQEANESFVEGEKLLLHEIDELNIQLSAARAVINQLAEESARLRGYLQAEVADNMKLNKMLAKVRNLIDGDD